jgi:hypothetical protein
MRSAVPRRQRWKGREMESVLDRMDFRQCPAILDRASERFSNNN